MESRVAIIEISNTFVRLIIGGSIDGEPVVIQKVERPISGLISRGEVLDEQKIVAILSELKSIEDEKTHLIYDLNDVTLVIPPVGLEIYESEKTTNVVSPSSIIEKLDISNVISLVQKEPIESDKIIVDVIPDYFKLEGERYSIEPPIGDTSNYVYVHAKVHVMLRKYAETYRRLVQSAGMRVRRICVSPFALSTYARKKGIAKDYLLVDMGAQVTNITLVGNHAPICTTHILCGGNDLSFAIAEKFNCSVEDAHKLKESYGKFEHKLAFKPVLFSSMSEEGLKVNYYSEDLDHVIDLFFRDNYFKQIDNALMTMLKDYPPEVLKLPMVICGGFSKMRGLEKLAKEKYSEQEVIFLDSDVLGVRHPKYLPLVGGLMCATHYKGALSDQRNKVNNIERV